MKKPLEVLQGYRFLLMRAESLRRELAAHYTGHECYRACADLLNAKIAEIEEEARRLREAVDAIPEAVPREIIRMRYIDGLSQFDIEDRTYYSKTRVYALQKRGLDWLEKKYCS